MSIRTSQILISLFLGCMVVASASSQTATVSSPALLAKIVEAEVSLSPIVGTWCTLDKTGKLQPETKLTFDARGVFKCTGQGWSSEGTYVRRDRFIVLTWSKVDDEKVAKPFSRTIEVNESMNQLQIERFSYVKTTQ